MTHKQFRMFKKLMLLFTDYPTWTKDKRGIYNCAMKYIMSGTHEFFRSDIRIHGSPIGVYYIENKDHKRRGTLMKYRGKKIVVMCVGQGGNYVGHYVVATVEPENKKKSKEKKNYAEMHQRYSRCIKR